MITAQSPCRIGLFGGGTDLPVFSDIYGGICINIAINLRHKVTLGGESKLLKNDNTEFIKAFTNLPVQHEFDAVSESGLGSSASLAVALVGADNKSKGIYMNRREIAERAWDIEVNKLGLFGGRQDQYAAVYGGMNTFYFGKNGVSVQNIDRDKAEFISRHILLFYTGENRKNIKIQEQLKTLSSEKVESLMRIKKMAHDAKKYIFYGDFKMLGELFDAAWTEKKRSNPLITTQKIDDIYDTAMSYGAMGGKLMGSGGGGFMFFWASPNTHSDIIQGLESVGCKHYDFSVCYNGLETRLL